MIVSEYPDPAVDGRSTNQFAPFSEAGKRIDIQN